MKLIEFKNQYLVPTPNMPYLPPKIEGWNSESIVFKQVIEQIEPESIVEIGSWYGASAIHMASLTQAPIICVDTFLGSNEILWREKNVKNLITDIKIIYEQFCANITYKNLNEQINALPMTSSSAAELFQTLNVEIDLIYLDAGHRYREVYADLQDWWPLTKKALIGDDYSSQWPGVIQAVNQFANENDLKINLLDSKFILFR